MLDSAEWKFDDWTITRHLAAELRGLLRPGMVTLECGSGLSTRIFLAAGCRHTALEHDRRFMPEGVAGWPAILAPLVGDPPWYDWRPAGRYDLILIDGPPQDAGGRAGILRVLGDMLTGETVIVVDDTRRPAERKLADEIARRWGFQAEWHQEVPRGYCVLRRWPYRFGQLSLYCTSNCNANCRYCGQAPARRRIPNYQMTLDQVERFAVRCRELEVHYQRIMLTGGEPTLWPDLIEGLQLIREAGITDLLGIYSNGIEIAPVKVSTWSREEAQQWYNNYISEQEQDDGSIGTRWEILDL